MSAALDLRALTAADLDREAVRRRGLAEFVRRAWSQVEPAALQWNWHLDAMAEHVSWALQLDVPRAERVARDLVINVPPGMSKSLVASVLAPAWAWTLDPTYRWICASYAPDVVLRDARKSRTLVQSDWYAARWPAVRIPDDASASKAVSSFYTTAGGMRYSTTVRGSVTGQHGDAHLIDDPLDPQGAAAVSGVELDATLEWWNGTMPTRFRDLRRPIRVLIMQRVHARDLAAEMKRQGATVLCLPMEFERTHPDRWRRDPRATDGELLDPARVDAAAVADLKVRLGPLGYAAQEQQRPVPAGGFIFKPEYFRHEWTELPEGGEDTLSVDCAFKDTRASSWVVIQWWRQVGPHHYLVDQLRGHWGFAETCQQILVMAARAPRAFRKLIEDKANGPAVIEALRPVLAGIEPVNPEGGKEARAHATTPLWSAGNVWVPHAELARHADGRRGAAWVREFVAEHLAFPRGPADDQVDAATQYLVRRGQNRAALFEQAMQNLRKKG